MEKPKKEPILCDGTVVPFSGDGPAGMETKPRLEVTMIEDPEALPGDLESALVDLLIIWAKRAIRDQQNCM